MQKKIFIEGMSCNHCVNHVIEAMKELDESIEVSVNLEEKFALINKDLDSEQIIKQLEEFGFEVTKII